MTASSQPFLRSARTARWLPRVGYVLLGVLCAMAVYRAAFQESHRTDFTVYTVAARALLEGGELYEVANPRGWMYHYLPVFAVLMVPFALLGPVGSIVAYAAVMAGMCLHGLRLSTRLARSLFPGSTLPPVLLAAGIAALVAWPLASGVPRGQASVVLAYLAVLAIVAHLERRDWVAGLALSGAIVLKIFPVLLLGYWVAKRRWRAVLATVAGLVLLVVAIPSAALGVQRNLDLLDTWVRDVALRAGTADATVQDARFEQMLNPHLRRNQSLPAVLTRWMADDTRDAEARRGEALARKLGALASLSLLALVAALCLPGRGDPADRRTAFQLSLVLVLSLVVSPNTWLHNCLMLAVPVGLLLALATTPGEPRAVAARAGLAALAAGTLLARVHPSLQEAGTYLLGMLGLGAALGAALLPGAATQGPGTVAVTADEPRPSGP